MHFIFLFTVAENLQNIIQEQIRSLSSGHHSSGSNNRDREYKESGNPKSGKQQAQQSVMQHPAPQSAPTTTLIAAAPTLNANAQAALMILLTAQMQSQTGEASILQNPQVVGILQNLVNQVSTS
jgi:hypothetical protein